MEINKIKMAAEIAKSRTNDKRWTAAINRAVEESATWTIAKHEGYLLITSNSGSTYRVDGRCNCRAGVLNHPCKHLAYRRLAEIAADERAELIADITAKVPAQELSAWLVRRCGVTKIDSRWLHIDTLRQIHQAA